MKLHAYKRLKIRNTTLAQHCCRPFKNMQCTGINTLHCLTLRLHCYLELLELFAVYFLHWCHLLAPCPFSFLLSIWLSDLLKCVYYDGALVFVKCWFTPWQNGQHLKGPSKSKTLQSTLNLDITVFSQFDVCDCIWLYRTMFFQLVWIFHYPILRGKVTPSFPPILALLSPTSRP